MKYKIIIFDADETLFDFKNLKEMLLKMLCWNLI